MRSKYLGHTRPSKLVIAIILLLILLSIALLLSIAPTSISSSTSSSTSSLATQTTQTKVPSSAVRNPSAHSTSKLSFAIALTSCPSDDSVQHDSAITGLSDGSAVLRHSIIRNMMEWDGTLDFVAIVHESVKDSECVEALR